MMAKAPRLIPATGAITGDLNDLWRYNPVTGEWTWMKGSNATGAAGVYGAINTPAAGNTPGARSAGSGRVTVDSILGSRPGTTRRSGPPISPTPAHRQESGTPGWAPAGALL